MAENVRSERANQNTHTHKNKEKKTKRNKKACAHIVNAK